MHRISKDRLPEMLKTKLSFHIVKKTILDNEHQTLVEILKGLNLMVKLYQNGLCVHLPIYAVFPT